MKKPKVRKPRKAGSKIGSTSDPPKDLKDLIYKMKDRDWQNYFIKKACIIPSLWHPTRALLERLSDFLEDEESETF